MDAAGLDRWLREFARRVDAEKDHLTALDSAIGDADHGANMARGSRAVVAAFDAETPADPAALLKKTGMTLVSTVGGASGPLYGTFFLRVATAFGSEESLDAAGFGRALRAGLEGVVQRGKAAVGDKTMLDALTPAVDAYDEAVAGGGGLTEALRAAAAAAESGQDATVPLVARKGRASYLGERSAGHADPGAMSVTLLLAAAADALGGAAS
ncbi:MAG: dihydroxyacetone kinase subunit DhaL [Actinomycetota bacterium]|nr:dihydroxyacetone kinase subunit DhaL [Actinomycetota bacterium]